MPRLVVLSAAVFTILSLNHVNGASLEEKTFSWQSGPSVGPLFAGEMFFDDYDNTIYFSAETYSTQFQGGVPSEKASCLTMSFSIETEQVKASKVYGESNTIDFCTALTLSYPGQLIYVGNSEPSGWSKDFMGTNVNSALYGLVAVLNKDTLEPEVGNEKMGHVIVTDNMAEHIPYPQDVCTDSNGDIWVVSLTSTDLKANVVDSNYPNWLHDKIEYGSSVDMNLSRYSWYEKSDGDEIDGISWVGEELTLVLAPEYSVEYPMDPAKNNGNIPRVYIGGMIMKNVASGANYANDFDNDDQNSEFLIVAGSTRGTSDGYGPSQGNDEDGFISFIDRDTGKLVDVTDMQDGSIAKLSGMTKNNIRIGTAEDDILTGICNDYTDPNFFYVVGATKGLMESDIHKDVNTDIGAVPAGSLQAFVSKMRVDNLEAVWTRQFFAVPKTAGGKSEAYALSCIIDDEGLYVSGNVEQDGSMYDVKTSKILPTNGGADIFVVSLNRDNGDQVWMKQIGSSGDDRMAKHGGIDSTSFDTVLLYGETNGDLFRPRETGGNNDMFVLSMRTKDGSYMSDPKQGDDDDDDDYYMDDDDDADIFNDAGFSPRGWQIVGDMYAGGIVYDSEAHDVKFTGGSYKGGLEKSMCFSGVWNLNSGDVKKLYHTGTVESDEACNAIAWSPTEDKSYSIGFTNHQSGGFFDYMTDDSDNFDIKVLGTIVQNNARGQPVGGGVIDEEHVQYPVAVVTHPSEDSIFVASLSSNYEDTPSSWDTTLLRPDLTVGGHHQKYGHSYFVSVARYDVNQMPNEPEAPLPETMSESWYNWFNVQDNPNDVLVTDIALAGNKGDTLVLVGNTKGSGNVFGTNSGNDMDGWMLKLDPSTGDVFSTNANEIASKRIDSSNSEDDWVNGICVDKFDPQNVFIVGATKGKIRTLDEDHQLPEGSIHAFIAKIHLSDLKIRWVKHFTMKAADGKATAEASAFSCVVAQGEGNKNVVYMAGTIFDGAVMDGAIEQKSEGGSDIFVIQIDDDGSNVNWIRQVGTPADERLAEGKGIDVDADGNVIVYGDTNGAFYAESPSGKKDLVLFTMARKDGDYMPLGSTGGAIVVGNDNDIIIGAPDDTSDETGLELNKNLFASQTGPDIGPSYAGGMIYDTYSNSVYVTGATYGAFSPSYKGDVHSTSYCFFGVMTLPTLTWKERQIFGSDKAPEACNALGLSNGMGRPSAVIAGTTEKGGLFTETSDMGGDTQFGFLMELSDKGAGIYKEAGNFLMDEDKVQFPAAIVTKEDGTVFVASMSSHSTRITADYEKVSRDEYPNFTSGGIEKFGSNYGLVMEAFKLDDTTGLPITRKWRKPFNTADLSSLFVSGLVQVNDDVIVMVGSTRASNAGDDMDGIMAKIDTKDGSFYKESGGTSKSVSYFASVDGADDWLMNACVDPNDKGSFYVVGSTASKVADSNALNALVAKIRLIDLQPEWTKEIGVVHASGSQKNKAAASVLGCDVIPNTGKMYIAGTVENGARMDYEGAESAGLDDIFVALLDTSEGQVNWLKQIGSNGDDRLARGGGVKADENRNALLYGDTTGDFFRSRDNDGRHKKSHDLFFLTVDMDTGAFQTPLEGKPFPSDTSAPSEWFGKSGGKDDFLLFLAIVLVVVLVFLYVWIRRKQRRAKAESQKTSIFAYLQQFDVEDVDLRKSPPGGWHGTYLNKLAYGINKSEAAPYSDSYSDEPEYLDAKPLSHSSIVSDSLFMDTASTPSLGDNTLGNYDDISSKYSSSIPGREVV